MENATLKPSQPLARQGLRLCCSFVCLAAQSATSPGRQRQHSIPHKTLAITPPRRQMIFFREGIAVGFLSCLGLPLFLCQDWKIFCLFCGTPVVTLKEL